MNNLLRHLRLVDLELLITTATLKNLSKAAAVHNLSQSAASSAIQRVEIAFGQKFFHHERRQFRLTHEGLTLIPKIEKWLMHFKETIAESSTLPLRVATTHAIARVILPRILPIASVEIRLARPDGAYAAILRDEADIAIVPDNTLWSDVVITEIGHSAFGLYCSQKDCSRTPILLPEDQIEVVQFIQRWNSLYHEAIDIKARIPSWSLIADLCSNSKEVGFLPEFLAKESNLHPVHWQPELLKFRLLALSRSHDKVFQDRLDNIVKACQSLFLTTT
ncbi:MAG: LysR family transcriptional regulator [Gammaproteobacteria bacterium]